MVCSGYENEFDVIGKKLNLICDGEVRQTLTVSGEKKMINQKTNFKQKAFETHDKVLLSQEEAQSGKWQLIGDCLIS